MKFYGFLIAVLLFGLCHGDEPGQGQGNGGQVGQALKAALENIKKAAGGIVNQVVDNLENMAPEPLVCASSVDHQDCAEKTKVELCLEATMPLGLKKKCCNKINELCIAPLQPETTAQPQQQPTEPAQPPIKNEPV